MEQTQCPNCGGFKVKVSQHGGLPLPADCIGTASMLFGLPMVGFGLTMIAKSPMNVKALALVFGGFIVLAGLFWITVGLLLLRSSSRPQKREREQGWQQEREKEWKREREKGWQQEREQEQEREREQEWQQEREQEQEQEREQEREREATI
jgi:flagellar biosynthesis/type III secretory pathway M-ring protein FliF/YscJ